MATDESDPSNADVNDGRAMVSPLGIFNLQKLQPVIEVMAKLFLAGSVFLYSLGLFISNLYFQQFGLTTFSLFKAQYVLVGLLWFLLMVLCLIITAGVFDGVRALIRAQNGEISKHRASSMKVFWDLVSIGATVFIGRNCLRALGIRDLSAWEYFAIVLIMESNFLCLALLVSAISHAVRGT